MVNGSIPIEIEQSPNDNNGDNHYSRVDIARNRPRGTWNASLLSNSMTQDGRKLIK